LKNYIDMSTGKQQLNRRQFLKASAAAVITLSAVGSLAFWLKDKSDVKDKGFLRPPGAIPEEDFLFACIKCGLCVQICPVHAVKLADWDTGLSYGTPYIDPNVQACDFSCDSIQCAETCPTSALHFPVFRSAGEKAVEELYKQYPNRKLPPNVNPFVVQIHAMKRAYKLGVAKVNVQQCLAYHGQGYKGPLTKHRAKMRPPGKGDRIYTDEITVDRKICDLCVVYCPLQEDAIVLKDQGGGKFLPEVLDGCVGCGVCQMVCPTEPKAIVIEPEENPKV